MKNPFIVSLFVSTFALSGVLTAEVPEKLVTQALADLADMAKAQGGEMVKGERDAAAQELAAPGSPLDLSPTAFAEYEAGGLEISALVLQETVSDALTIFEGAGMEELPTMAAFYLEMHQKSELNADQKILCYLALKSVLRKAMTADQ